MSKLRIQLWFFWWSLKCWSVLMVPMIRHISIWRDTQPDILQIKMDRLLIDKSRKTRRAEYRFFTSAQTQIRYRRLWAMIDSEISLIKREIQNQLEPKERR